MSGPLSDITVVDFSELLPGPFMTNALNEMGAKIIKVERPKGDPLRKMSPGMFAAVNSGKVSVNLDLKTAEGAAQAMELCKTADVVVEGFRPGVMARFGLGPQDVVSTHPSVIYVSLSGYGQTGPLVDEPGHDINYLATSGVLSISGQADGPPEMSFGLPVADLTGAMFGVSAISAALFDRTRTGLGQSIDLSLTDCMAYLANPRRGMFSDAAAVTPDAQRQMSQTRPAYGVFSCLDGAITVAALEDHFWQALTQAVDMGPYADAKYGSISRRWPVANDINAFIQSKTGTEKKHGLLKRLAAKDVPAADVLSLNEAIASRHFQARKLSVPENDPPMVRFPVRLSGM